MSKTGEAETLTLKMERPAYGGLAVARHEGRVVLVSSAMPGETVEARVTGRKKDYSLAETVKVVVPSPGRIGPPCPYFGDCGGCQLQYASYEAQVRIKEAVLADTLRRIAGLDARLEPPLTGAPWAYRRRGRFKAWRGRLGLYRGRTHHVVDIGSCPLMDGGVDEAYRKARPLVHEHGFTGELSITFGNTAVALVRLRGPEAGTDGRLARSLMESGFAGVTVRAGGEPVVLGDGHTRFELDGLAYTVSAGSFFQANWALDACLVRAVVAGLGPLEGARVLELYAGAGNFALPLARAGAVVVAVEQDRDAASDGERNAALNGLGGVGFVRASAEAVELDGAFDAAVVDPPRTGLERGALDRLLALGTARMAYVSCDPATLARDLKRLAGAYRLESVRLVDFFPQTYHIEALALLSLR